MTLTNEKFSISFQEKSAVDITLKIQGIVRNLDSDNALLFICANNSSSSIALIEDDASDIFSSIKNIVEQKTYLPENLEHYNPEKYANLSANIIGHSINLPVINKELQISITQKIVLINFSDSVPISDVIVSIVQ